MTIIGATFDVNGNAIFAADRLICNPDNTSCDRCKLFTVNNVKNGLAGPAAMLDILPFLPHIFDTNVDIDKSCLYRIAGVLSMLSGPDKNQLIVSGGKTLSVIDSKEGILVDRFKSGFLAIGLGALVAQGSFATSQKSNIKDKLTDALYAAHSIFPNQIGQYFDYLP